MIHKTKHKLSNKTVKIKNGAFAGEDYCDRVLGDSYYKIISNPVCFMYIVRTGLQKFSVPKDNQVLYGKIGSVAHLVHESEL